MSYFYLPCMEDKDNLSHIYLSSLIQYYILKVKWLFVFCYIKMEKLKRQFLHFVPFSHVEYQKQMIEFYP